VAELSSKVSSADTLPLPCSPPGCVCWPCLLSGCYWGVDKVWGPSPPSSRNLHQLHQLCCKDAHPGV